MEEEDDDFYGGEDVGQDINSAYVDVEPTTTTDKMDMSDGDEEEDDSDDDVQFTLEKPEGAKQASASGPKSNNQIDRTVSSGNNQVAKSSTPVRQEAPRAGSTVPPTIVKGALTHDGKEGKDFPESRTSKIDVNSIPTWQANGKPIIDVDIDADLAENSKPWRLPGTDQTDYFNYGFDEYTWVQYCVKQKSMGDIIGDLKSRDAQVKAFMNGGPGGGMPGMPPGMGMPDPEQFMQMFNQQMMPPDFQQQMMQMGGGGIGPFPSGGFGSGQNSASPQPQAGQGFQPPSGPSGGGGGHGQQGGFAPGNMEGYSPQQMAIMQQEQGQMQGGSGGGGGGGGGAGGGGGGGGKGRNRRGRGYY